MICEGVYIERLNVYQVGLGVLGIGTAATLAATFALAQQYGELPKKRLETFKKSENGSSQHIIDICSFINESIWVFNRAY